MIRVGLGYDAHRLKKGRPLFLGGVKIPYVKVLEGHSDAYVILMRWWTRSWAQRVCRTSALISPTKTLAGKTSRA